MTRFPIDGTGRLSSEIEHPTAALTGPAGGDLTGNFPNPAVASWVVSDHAPHGATVGEGLTFNGSVFVGTDRDVDIWNTQTSPGSVTDWGAIINARLAAGNRTFAFAGVKGILGDATSGRAYPYSTPIDVSNLAGVSFLGPGGKVDVYGNSAAWGVEGDVSIAGVVRMPAFLKWTGTGSGSALKLEGTSGFVMRGLGLYYSSASFTGRLIDLDTSSSGAVFECNDIGGLDRNLVSALCNFSLSNCWNHTIRGNTIQGAQYNFYGNVPAGANVFSDTIRILENDCAFVTGAHFGGSLHEMWKIARNFLSLAPAPAAAGGANYPQVMNLTKATGGAGSYYATILFEENDCWDEPGSPVGGQTRPLFVFGQPISAKIRANDVKGTAGSNPVIQCTGGGYLVVEDNANMGNTASQTGPRVDLGDTTGIALPFQQVTIKRNGVLNGFSGADEVINRFGHAGLEIDAGDLGYESRVQASHELSGQERVTKHLFHPAPTIAALTGLGVSGSAAIYGNDMVGLLHLISGGGSYAAGDLAKVTLGVPLVADPNGPYGYIAGQSGYVILLTPTFQGTVPPVAAQVATDLYTWFNPADPQSWTVGSLNAPTGYDFWIAYRIMAI